MSLPSRERELKLRTGREKAKNIKSLPSRERELKRESAVVDFKSDWSLPSRERELKPLLQFVRDILLLVAPFTGARVETLHTAEYLAVSSSRSLHGSAS